jgi:hypothetical protein
MSFRLSAIKLSSTIESTDTLTYKFSNEYGSGNLSYLRADNFQEHLKGMVNKAMDIFVNGGTVDGSPFEAQGPHLFDACYIRYAFRLYDGTLTKHSPPILVLPSKKISELKIVNLKAGDTSSIGSGAYVQIFGYRIKIETEYYPSGFSDWYDIIKSVDLFMSAPLGISSAENIKDFFKASESNKDTPLVDTSSVLERAKVMTPLFFLRSLTVSVGYSLTDYVPGPDDKPIFESLLQQEVMSDDNFSHHNYGANASYVYNSRLHLADIKTSFFTGYDLKFFHWYGSYNGIANISPGTFDMMMEIIINAGGITKTIYKKLEFISFFGSAVISYPDARATQINLYYVHQANWEKFLDIRLTPHDSLNIAYYINQKLEPFRPGTYSAIGEKTQDVEDLTFTEANKIKVSELNNPMFFSNRNVYTVGDGDILAMATNSMNVADQNYGQHPLYVFTTQGIWTLSIGSGEVTYSTLAAPTSTETPVSKIACPTPFGVVFISKKGLMLINGNAVEFLSPQLEGLPEIIHIEEPTQYNSNKEPTYPTRGVILHFDGQSFHQYLSGVDNILYNPYESELILVNRQSEFNYVLNIPSKSFYQSTEKIKVAVKNAFPELLVCSDYEVKSYAESGDSGAHVSFITRPLRFGLEDIKKLDRMILRGVCHDLDAISVGTVDITEKNPIIVISHSNDGDNFQTTRGRILNPANYRDIDMGLMSRSKFRKFILSFGARISEESKMISLDSMIAKEYVNEKMR